MTDKVFMAQLNAEESMEYLQQVLNTVDDPAEIAHLLNQAREGIDVAISYITE